MRKILSKDAPKPLGPYSQAILAGPFMHVSAQLPLDTEGKLVEGGIDAQIEQVFDNIEAILREVNLGWAQVLTMEIAVTDLGYVETLDQHYEQRTLHSVRPARHLYAVQALPKGAFVQVSCLATTSLW